MATSMTGECTTSPGNLKAVLYETLVAILSPEHDVRASGEEQLKTLEVTEEFGLHLAEFTVDSHGVLAVRQLASVLLKQYVDYHWSVHSEKFRPPETNEQVKTAIRRVLPVGLIESISKVRSSVAYAISAIAHWDWPESWPELFGQLMQALTSGDQNAVHGAMRVLTEFTQEVTDTQMPHMAPVILPEMYKIFTNAESYSIRTRSRAVIIFTTCATIISDMGEFDKSAKSVLLPFLPKFTEAFVQALQVPDGMASDSGLKMDVLKALTTLLKTFPKTMAPYMAQILQRVWVALTESATIYVRTVVNNIEETDDPVDSDGEVLGFENLVFSIFEFVHALIETPKFRKVVRKSVDQLLYFVILYMQITEDQIRLWTSSPDQFVEDEDEDTFSYSVRISAQDLLLALASEFEQETATGVCSATLQHLQESDAAKNSESNPHWWKIHESCMLTLGSVKSVIIDLLQEQKISFDIQGFLQNVVMTDLNLNVSPFLLGRALWVASRYSLVMSAEMLQRFIQSTVAGLQDSQLPCVRISAARSIYSYCDHLKNSNHQQILVPFLEPIIHGLVTLATQYAGDVLALVLETVYITLKVDKAFTGSCENRVVPLTIAIFLKYNADPLITALCQDIFKVFAQNDVAAPLLQQRLLPTLISILQAPPERLPPGLPGEFHFPPAEPNFPKTSHVSFSFSFSYHGNAQPSTAHTKQQFEPKPELPQRNDENSCSAHQNALDVLCALVRNLPTPLTDAVISEAFPAAANCTLNSEDNAVLQSGGECLRAYVSVACDQISQWQDDQNRNGLWYVVQVTNQMLDPRVSEFTAAFVGKLVSTLITKVGRALGDNLDLMLRAVLSKMQQAETLSVLQSLVMVFAHLVHTQLDAVLSFLTTMPGPTGNSALEFVLTEWLSRHHLFYGAYETKVSTIALCKLIQYGIQHNDLRFQDMHVKGDEVFSPSSGVKTRSKAAAAPQQWTMVPVLVKMYKLIVNELSNQIEISMSKANQDGGDDEDWEGEEDEEDEDDEEGHSASRDRQETLQDLLRGSDYMGFDPECGDGDDDEDDAEALQDPIYQVNLQNYLTDFLQQLSQQPYYVTFSQHHSDSERKVLSTIGINA